MSADENNRKATTTVADNDWRKAALCAADAEHSMPLAVECTWAIESACVEILGRIAQGAQTPEQAHVLRYFQMTTMRIKQLNSVLISFLDGNDIDVGTAFHEVYGCFAKLEEQQP